MFLIYCYIFQLHLKIIPKRVFNLPSSLSGSRCSSKVHTIAGSRVGGGSVVYTNVTEEPDESVIDSWDTQLNLGINYSNFSKYFDMARGFIGVNKIATTTGIGTNKLLKTKAFQDTAEKIRQETPGIIKNPDKKSAFDPANPDQNAFVEDIYAADHVNSSNLPVEPV